MQPIPAAVKVAVPSTAIGRAPLVTKGELRGQIETLEAANAKLRAKGRDASREVRAAAKRVAELEAQVAELQAQAARTTAPVPTVPEAKASRRGRAATRTASIDPGSAVPPGVAVQEPQPLDEEAQAARDALDEHLSGE